MERKRDRVSDNPMKLTFELIKRITNNFSEVLGRGTFGQVFKGMLEDGEEIAVKMHRFMPNINDQQFENEFEIHKRLKHPNIVQLVGFCDEAKEECVEYNGNLIVCQRIHRALCLEYMPKGSLGKLLSGENLGNNWPIRYAIIKGICEGLKYLQEGLEFPIFHLDLKPDNILLNEKMMPKISDFGLSRFMDEENSKRTLTPLGTIGYLPPEFINYQVISKEYDIYSLGVIIAKTITGNKGYSDVADMGPEEFVEHVHEYWKRCLQEIPKYASLEVDCKQVKSCIEIARRCMDNDRHKRPIINDIVSQMDEMGNLVCPVELDAQLKMEKGLVETKGRVVPVLNQDSVPVQASSAPPAAHYCNYHSGPVCKDPPPKMRHRAHPEHKLELKTAAVAPFLCDGCKEPGYGPRYTRDCGGDDSFDLHTRCALAQNPLVLPLFGYGKLFEFCFLYEPPRPVEASVVCDACGEATRGYVYHCFGENVDLHPCCASLPDRIVLHGHAFELRRKASRPCVLCADTDDSRCRWFWAYTSYLDGEAVDLHVACLKEAGRRSWEANYHNRDVGENTLHGTVGFDKFGEFAGTIASFVTEVVFGNIIFRNFDGADTECAIM